MKLVSACLLGQCCRYDGGSKPDSRVIAQYKKGEMTPFCPETAGGLQTPRQPCEIIGGDGHDVIVGTARVVNREGVDVTDEFLRGARLALDECVRLGVNHAVLKARSPSCGSCQIYDGTFSGTLILGDGVTAALLKEAGIKVTTEEDSNEG